MKYAIDRIENNIAILEDIDTKEKVEVSTLLLPSNIQEGTILLYKDNKYILDLKEETARRSSIQDKFNKLKKKD